MSRPYFSAKHVGTMSLLPENLVRGRAYFVDDEQIIVIDHGQGAVIYGGKPGPQGIAGEPLPQLQDQIDQLAEAELLTQKHIWELTQRSDSKLEQVSNTFTEQLTQAEKDLAHFTALSTDTDSHLQSQINTNSEAMLSLIDTIQAKFTEIDSAIAILTKTIASLYPSNDPADYPDRSDPLDGEIITTDSGSWVVQQSTLSDGTMLLELEAQQLLIDTLKVGDRVDYDGSTWLVEDYSVDGGIITLELRTR